jgi:1-acyl-sn-glycerol-3-phosphate acyltransferase
MGMSTLAKEERARVIDGEIRRNVVARHLFLPLRWLFKLYFGITFFLSLLILYIPFKILLRKPSGYEKAFHLKRYWAKVQQFISLIPSSVRRTATLPGPPYIICCNHSSYLDIIHMYNVIPQYFVFIGKQELARWPLIGMFFKGMNIAVNRSNQIEAARAFRRAAQAIDQGTSVAIFPEGTIPAHAPRMKPFKDGAFKLAIEKQVPIVPVTFIDHWKLFGEPGDIMSRARPGIARAVVHKAIPTKGMTEADLVALRQQVFATIEGPLLQDQKK